MQVLSEAEIEDICNVLNDDGATSDAPETNTLTNAKESLRLQLQGLKLFKECIPDFKKEIRKQYFASQLQPGEMVGVIAASSIGEQNTQASLNSFHTSGTFKANLTGGLARLNELMNATENTKTPSLTIYFHPDVEQTLENVRRLCFTRLVWVELDEIVQRVKFDSFPELTGQDDDWYPFFNQFFSTDYQRAIHRLRLYLDVEKLWKHQISMHTIYSKITQLIDCTDKMFFAYSHETQGIFDIWINDNFATFAQALNLQPTCRILNTVPNAQKIQYYISKVVLPLILPIHLSGVEGIKECYFTEHKGNWKKKANTTEWRVDTKGGNLKALLKVSCVDGLRCISNDMHEIFELFGIEAVKQFLRDEYSSLISKVNPRHLELLIDSMTVTGNISRVTRNGIDRKQVGTISKASFEQPVENFLISACLGEVDPLMGVSAAITVGKQSKIGTGFFTLRNDEQKKRELELDLLQQEEFQQMQDITVYNQQDMDYADGEVEINEYEVDLDCIEDDQMFVE
jgi:DNA-directed RNA polymerase beta' subunit